MLAPKRREEILHRLSAVGAVRIAELTQELGVTDMTIRRDIDQLVAAGWCQRVHGGAIRTGAVTEEPAFAQKETLNQAAKAAIGQAAAGLVQAGDSVAISGGTTTFTLARHLLQLSDLASLTILTNSLPVADLLFNVEPANRPTILLSGGERTASDALVGPLANQALATLHTNWLFLGVHSLSVAAGLTTPNLQEAQTNRALMAAAGTVVVVADSTKWGRQALAQIAPLDQADLLVTDAALGPVQVKQARQYISEVRTV